jgi:hypothetical protein
VKSSKKDLYGTFMQIQFYDGIAKGVFEKGIKEKTRYKLKNQPFNLKIKF